ncbi:helix-turn-helix domain-containing protein [Granulicella aggregans]|uniref:helix-turn-helix domain-containing protein n=1 Tax=Granulicella aggregans TaxID=474949 RepID=UPI0021E031E3|nr:AraC family transcriptional regulator [Granulicella aggregans]
MQPDRVGEPSRCERDDRSTNDRRNHQAGGRVLSYLHQHYQDQNAVERLSRIDALSRSSLHRLFKLHTGATITEYISRLRIGNTCALLINTERSISLIADDVGYRNLAKFNRQFKAFKSTTPRQFRSAFNVKHA